MHVTTYTVTPSPFRTLNPDATWIAPHRDGLVAVWRDPEGTHWARQFTNPEATAVPVLEQTSPADTNHAGPGIAQLSHGRLLFLSGRNIGPTPGSYRIVGDLDDPASWGQERPIPYDKPESKPYARAFDFSSYHYADRGRTYVLCESSNLTKRSGGGLDRAQYYVDDGDRLLGPGLMIDALSHQPPWADRLPNGGGGNQFPKGGEIGGYAAFSCRNTFRIDDHEVRWTYGLYLAKRVDADEWVPALGDGKRTSRAPLSSTPERFCIYPHDVSQPVGHQLDVNEAGAVAIVGAVPAMDNRDLFVGDHIDWAKHPITRLRLWIVAAGGMVRQHDIHPWLPVDPNQPYLVRWLCEGRIAVLREQSLHVAIFDGENWAPWNQVLDEEGRAINLWKTSQLPQRTPGEWVVGGIDKADMSLRVVRIQDL